LNGIYVANVDETIKKAQRQEEKHGEENSTTGTGMPVKKWKD
jgi:hypothetical protein